jgi:hypothetical protein
MTASYKYDIIDLENARYKIHFLQSDNNTYALFNAVTQRTINISGIKINL